MISIDIIKHRQLILNLKKWKIKICFLALKHCTLIQQYLFNLILRVVCWILVEREAECAVGVSTGYMQVKRAATLNLSRYNSRRTRRPWDTNCFFVKLHCHRIWLKAIEHSLTDCHKQTIALVQVHTIVSGVYRCGIPFLTSCQQSLQGIQSATHILG